MKKIFFCLFLLVSNFCYPLSPGDTVEIISDGQLDGWIKGDSVNNIGIISHNAGIGRTGLLIGDNEDDRGDTGFSDSQVVSILSFDTSIFPSGTTFSSGQIKLTLGGIEGNVDEYGYLYFDIKTGAFGEKRLEKTDFQEIATDDMVTTMAIPIAKELASYAELNPATLAMINNESGPDDGLTQFKIRFSSPTNLNSATDRVSFFPGEHGPTKYQPTLILVIDTIPTPSPTPSPTVSPSPTVGPTPSPSPSPSPTVTPTPIPNLVLWLPLDENSGFTTDDISGNNNNGTISGATWTTGKYNYALSFDGVNDNVQIPDANILDIQKDLTLMCEVKTNNSATGIPKTIIAKEGTNSVYAIRLDASNKPRAMIYDTNYFWTTSSTAIPTNDTWTHLTMTYDGQWLRLYVNASLVSERRRVTTGFSLIEKSNGVLRIGDDTTYPDINYQPFDGEIDNIRMYNRIISVNQIIDDMNTGQ